MSCFKAYDLRGKVPSELNTDLAWRVGWCYGELFAPAGPVAVGRDVRHSSVALADALIRGLNAAGVDTRDIGLCGTEMVYYASALPGMGGGIMVTASHNPLEYNGMKLVRSGAVPISGDTGLRELEKRVVEMENNRPRRMPPGTNQGLDIVDGYLATVFSFVSADELRPLKLLLNPGNGCAGPIVRKLLTHLPFRVTLIHAEPDGSFPNGIPNPLLPENRYDTEEAVRRTGADLGIAWDGDFDRCFFFDENGEFVEGYYIVGLLAQHLLGKAPGETVIHDPRLTWNTIEMVREAGGRPVQGRTGHAFMKEHMRAEQALYGGEMSAHHYFRGFSYCDSGMIPWLVIASILSRANRPFSELVQDRIRRFPVSGEINRLVADPDRIIAEVETRYRDRASVVEHVDGLSMEFADVWRFNLRRSQTEPMIRLNVETRGDTHLLRERTRELLDQISPEAENAEC